VTLGVGLAAISGSHDPDRAARRDDAAGEAGAKEGRRSSASSPPSTEPSRAAESLVVLRMMRGGDMISELPDVVRPYIGHGAQGDKLPPVGP